MTADAAAAGGRRADRAPRRARRHRARLAGAGGARRRASRRRASTGWWMRATPPCSRSSPACATRIVVRAAADAPATASGASPARWAWRPPQAYLRTQRLRRRARPAGADQVGGVRPRCRAPRRVIGFTTRAAARATGGAGPTRETVAGPPDGHVVQKNLAVLPALGLAVPARPTFPWRQDSVRRWPTRSPHGRPSPPPDVSRCSIPARRGPTSGGRPSASARWPRGWARELGVPSLVTWGGRRACRSPRRLRRTPAAHAAVVAGHDVERPARAGPPRQPRRVAATPVRCTWPRPSARRSSDSSARPVPSATVRGTPPTSRCRAPPPASASTSGSASAARPASTTSPSTKCWTPAGAGWREAGA